MCLRACVCACVCVCVCVFIDVVVCGCGVCFFFFFGLVKAVYFGKVSVCAMRLLSSLKLQLSKNLLHFEKKQNTQVVMLFVTCSHLIFAFSMLTSRRNLEYSTSLEFIFRQRLHGPRAAELVIRQCAHPLSRRDGGERFVNKKNK